MAINPVASAAQNPAAAGKAAVSAAAAGTAGDTTQTLTATEAAVYEKSDQTSANTKTTYTRDNASISEITKQVDAKYASLKATVEALFTKQSEKAGQAQNLSFEQILETYDGKLKDFYQNLEVDEETRLAAQKEIAEDGFWGVKQTSERAIEFAKAISGGDPSKLGVLKDAIEKGYEAAEKAWGGELPEISQQTKEATLKGLDDWAKAAAQPGQTA